MVNAMTRSNLSSRLVGAILVLLLAAICRMQMVNNTPLVQDEARSILRSFGTISEIIAWQPLDWPPLYNVLLGGWQALIDPHPAILRMFSVLLFIPGAALTYQLGRKLFANERAGWGAMIVYCALGYSVFLSSFLRGYVITMTLFPALFLLTIRYFDMPSIRRSLLLAVVMAAMYYTTYTTAFAFIIVGVYMLIVYPRAVWRWWLPGLISFLLALPDLIQKAGFLANRVEAATTFAPHLRPPLEAFGIFYQEYTGQAALIWLGLFLLGALFLILRQRGLRTILLLLWVFVAPITIYVLVSKSIMFIYSARYAWWGLLGIALIIGAGLAYLPRRLWQASSVLILALMFVPLPEDYREDRLPYEEVLSWLRDHAVPGDVLVIDPQFCLENCGRGDAWVYYTAYYLSDRIQIVDSPEDYSRVWYLKTDGDGWHNEEMEARVENGRLGGPFVGPWNMLARLYEAPPDPEGILYTNDLRFHGFQVVENGEVLLPPYDIRELSTLHLRLWWSIDKPLSQEYSVNTLLARGGRNKRVIADANGAPKAINLTPNEVKPPPQSMLEWEPGKYYVEERDIQIPQLPETYEADLYLIVYQWWDGVRIAASETDQDTMLPLDEVMVMGW